MKTFTLILHIIVSLQSCNAKQIHDSTQQETMNNQDLIQAVVNNDTTLVAAALKQGAEVNGTDSEKRPLLLIATNHKHLEMANLLVKCGADVNQQANNKDSAFLYAGATGQTELLKLFIANGANFDIFNRYYGSALIPACERGHVETVRLLANTKSYPIDHVNLLGWTGLMEAVVLGDGSLKYQQIVQILKDAGANMHIPDHNGVTALEHAERKGYDKIVKIIKS